MMSKPQFVGKRVSFTDAFSEVSHGVKKFKQNQYLEYGAHPIVDQGQELIVGYSDDETGLFNDVPVIVFGDHTRCVKYVEEPFFAGADGVKILKPRLSDNTRFWWHELKATPIENLGYSRHFKLLKAATFKTFDMASQTEITARLDNILDQIVQANQQIEQLDQLVKSRFVEMFGDICEGTSRYDMVPINDLCIRIVGGGTPSTNHPEYYENGTIPWLKSGDVKTHIVESGVLNITEVGLAKSSARMVPEGSIIVVTRSGILKHSLPIAKTARSIAINQDLKALIPGNHILPDYLQWSLIVASPLLLSKVRATTADNIETSFLKSFRVPFPPMFLQRKFVKLVNQVDKSRFIAQQQIEKLQMLYDSLAQEYFGD